MGSTGCLCLRGGSWAQKGSVQRHTAVCGRHEGPTVSLLLAYSTHWSRLAPAEAGRKGRGGPLLQKCPGPLGDLWSGARVGGSAVGKPQDGALGAGHHARLSRCQVHSNESLRGATGSQGVGHTASPMPQLLPAAPHPRHPGEGAGGDPAPPSPLPHPVSYRASLLLCLRPRENPPTSPCPRGCLSTSLLD